MELKKLVKDIVIDTTTLPSLDVKDICSHSSNVTDGSLFVAIYGEEADGHDSWIIGTRFSSLTLDLHFFSS